MLCVSGTGSLIRTTVFPPIELTRGQWELALINLSTYNSVPNVEEGVNNTLAIITTDEINNNLGADEIKEEEEEDNRYADTATNLISPNKGIHKENTIRLPTGSYELDDIANFLKDELKSRNITLKIKANNNTLKCELKCTAWIDFTSPDSLAPLLGFEKKKLPPNIHHVSTNPVVINNVNIVRVECNLVRGSYTNGVEGHVLHEFALGVPPGYKIIESPQNIIYLPLNTTYIHEVTIKLTDQEGNLINLRGESVTIRLHLRNRSNNGIGI